MFSDPEKNIEQFSVGEGWKVADLGAGSGAYSFALAEVVGNGDGHVYAVDINQGLLSKISNEARERRLIAIEVVRGDLERVGGTTLRDQSVEAVVTANIFFMIEDKKALVGEVARILKLGGRVLVIDWVASFGGLGPHPDNIIEQDQLQALFENAGFTYEQTIDAGAQHYGLIFKR